MSSPPPSLDPRWAEIDTYISKLFRLEDDALRGGVAASEDAGLPSIQVSPPLGKLLHVLALAIGARRILELGTLGGFSGTWLARALPPDGKLITLELDPRHAEVARANFARAGVGERVEVRVGRALDTLPALERDGAGPFDLIFIDADKSSYPDYLEWAVRFARPGTLIVADNVVRRMAVGDEADDPNVRGIRRFNELLGADKRLSATVIQTVGVKGYDGFAIAVVRSH